MDNKWIKGLVVAAGVFMTVATVALMIGLVRGKGK